MPLDVFEHLCLTIANAVPVPLVFRQQHKQAEEARSELARRFHLIPLDPFDHELNFNNLSECRSCGLNPNQLTFWQHCSYNEG